MDVDMLRYPVGPMPRPKTPLDRETRAAHLATIEQLPSRMRSLVSGLSDAQLDTPYRPGGWTVRQVVHHVPESHMNAYIRMKLAVTEETPAVKTYEEQLWAELPDVKACPVESRSRSSTRCIAAGSRFCVRCRRSISRKRSPTRSGDAFRSTNRLRCTPGTAVITPRTRHHAAHIEQALEAATTHGG